MTTANEAEQIAVPGYIPGTWYVDPTHSQVSFTVRHSMVRLRCAFTDVRGIIEAGSTFEDSAVTATIDPLSFSTGLAIRDEKVRALPSFLWSDMHPSIDFVSTRIEATAAGDRGTVTGDLQLLGVTRPIRLDVTTTGIGRHEHYGTRTGFAATTRFDRRDFGLRGPSSQLTVSRPLGEDNEMLGWIIDVEIQIEAVLASEPGEYGIHPVYGV